MCRKSQSAGTAPPGRSAAGALADIVNCVEVLELRCIQDQILSHSICHGRTNGVRLGPYRGVEFPPCPGAAVADAVFEYLWSR